MRTRLAGDEQASDQRQASQPVARTFRDVCVAGGGRKRVGQRVVYDFDSGVGLGQHRNHGRARDADVTAIGRRLERHQPHVVGGGSVVSSYVIEKASSSNGSYSTLATVTLGVSGFTEFSSGITASSQPFGITTGPDGNVCFVENSGNKVAKMTTSGAVTEYSIPTASSGSEQIAAGPDGNLWFCERSVGKIGKVTTSGTFTEYTVPTANSQPQSIAVNADGNLWFAENNTNKIANITTTGTFTEYTVPTASSGPKAIISGS